MTKRYVNVRFLTKGSPYSANGDYTYRDSLKTPLQPFEVVLAPTRYGLSLGYVTKVDITETEGFVVGKVGIGSVKAVAERIKSKTIDKQLKSERAKAIEVQLKAKVEALDKLSVYKTYAKESPEIAELVEQLELLSK